MLRILLISSSPQVLPSFAEALSSDPGVQLDSAASGAEALETVRTAPPHLVVIDANLPDTKPVRLVQTLLTVNAMVNTAVMSPLSEEDFHRVTEGLGILARLPLDPGRDDAETLLIKLRKVMGLTS